MKRTSYNNAMRPAEPPLLERDEGAQHGPLFYLRDGDEAGAENAYLQLRTATVREFFPGALGIDDFMARVEMSLFQSGFTGDNSIAVLNLCRDEVCHNLAHKVHAVFGQSFSTHGLGGVMLCGVTGLKAGLSHAPNLGGRERYVFFSFPHIAIDSTGKVGSITRMGRLGDSTACGALARCLELFKGGKQEEVREDGGLVLDPLDPELSILRQNLARLMQRKGVDPSSLDLVEITRLAEQMISGELERLISLTVDTRKADYAVVTGVQIHHWAAREHAEAPDLEFVWPVTVRTVVKGATRVINLQSVPSLSPRQIRILGAHDHASGISHATALADPAHIQEMRTRGELFRQLIDNTRKSTPVPSNVEA